MRIPPSTSAFASAAADSPSIVRTSPIPLSSIFDAPPQHHRDIAGLVSPRIAVAHSSDDGSSPVAIVLLESTPANASAVEMRIFTVIFSILLLALSYFAVKGLVRTWRRHNGDYLLTWAHNHQHTRHRRNMCKCHSAPRGDSSSKPCSQQLETKIAATHHDHHEEGEVSPASTSSSGVGTVESGSDASAVETSSSNNPLLELLSAASPSSSVTSSSDASEQPSPPVMPTPTPPAVLDVDGTSAPIAVAAEIALMSRTMINGVRPSFSDAPILRHHHNGRRKTNGSSSNRRKRSSNSTPPSPVFPTRRFETDDVGLAAADGLSPAEIASRRQRRIDRDQYRRQRPSKSKRRVSLDAVSDPPPPPPPPVDFFIGTGGESPPDTPSTVVQSTNTGTVAVSGGVSDRQQPPSLPLASSSRPWVDDEETDGTSHSIPLSVATSPPDYFDTMNVEWERQGFCPLYKSHRSRGTETIPGTP